MPVVPVVLALEWFTQAARACCPGLVVDALRDVKVLRGIKLANFDGVGDWLTVTAREAAGRVHLELRGAKDALHYQATADVRAPSAPAPAIAAPVVPAVSAWDADIYDGHLLFHGPAFQGIRAVDGVSSAGMIAIVDPTPWPGGWATDPLALDCGLQLALLWTREVLGGASLPMGVDAYERRAEGPAPGPLRVVLTGRPVGRDRAVSDVVFTDAQGAVVAALRGVSTVLRPGEPKRS